MLKYLLFLLLSISNAQIEIPPNCFDLSKVQSLTFYHNAITTSAKSIAIQQLNCIGGNGCDFSKNIQSIQCINNGLNDQNLPQWTMEMFDSITCRF